MTEIDLHAKEGPVRRSRAITYDYPFSPSEHR